VAVVFALALAARSCRAAEVAAATSNRHVRPLPVRRALREKFRQRHTATAAS
jgi:hypothetical protein